MCYRRQLPHTATPQILTRDFASVSFGTFLFIQSKTEIDHDLLIAFEFSHIVIFFAAMIFVVGSTFMMILNQRIKRHIDVTAAHSSEGLAKSYEARKGDMVGWRGYLPKNRQLRLTIEFKVYNLFFCDHYQFPLSAFDFPSYMREILDKNVTNLLEVRERREATVSGEAARQGGDVHTASSLRS